MKTKYSIINLCGNRIEDILKVSFILRVKELPLINVDDTTWSFVYRPLFGRYR